MQRRSNQVTQTVEILHLPPAFELFSLVCHGLLMRVYCSFYCARKCHNGFVLDAVLVSTVVKVMSQ